MPNFIVALVLVFGGLWLIRKFGKLKPAEDKHESDNEIRHQVAILFQLLEQHLACIARFCAGFKRDAATRGIGGDSTQQFSEN